MKTITYICDTCKKSVSETDLTEITVSVKNIYFAGDSRWNKSSVKVDICKDCLKLKGFAIEEKIDDMDEEEHDEIKTKNEKLLKNKLIDVLKDLDVVFTEDLENAFDNYSSN